MRKVISKNAKTKDLEKHKTKKLEELITQKLREIALDALKKEGKIDVDGNIL